MKIISIIIYLILTVGGLILVKSGAESTSMAIQNGTFNFSMQLKVMLGFLAYVGSFLIYTFYIAWIGTEHFIEVPNDNRAVFTTVSGLSAIFIPIIISKILTLLMPGLTWVRG